MSYSCNDNQNYFVSETGRTTSRVLNPPGGAASFSLGFDAPPSSPPGAAKKQEPSIQQPSAPAVPPSVTMEARGDNATIETAPTTVGGTETAAPATAAAATMTMAAPTLPGDVPNPPVSSNAFASGANMNGANVMTGRPTSRVLAPPGGHSALGGSLW